MRILSIKLRLARTVKNFDIRLEKKAARGLIFKASVSGVHQQITNISCPLRLLMLESKVYCCYAELLRTAFFLFFLHSTPPPTLFQLPPSIYQTILDNHCSLRYFSLPYFSTSDLNET